MSDFEKELRAKKTSYDLATLFRVLPWFFIMGDKREPRALIGAAFKEACGFIEAALGDATRDRKALMRGLAINWFHAQGVQLDPGALEMIVAEIEKLTDTLIDGQYDDGLEGETA